METKKEEACWKHASSRKYIKLAHLAWKCKFVLLEATQTS